MAIRNSMESVARPNSLFVTKASFYWAMGAFFLLIVAVSYSLSRNIASVATSQAPGSSLYRSGAESVPGTGTYPAGAGTGTDSGSGTGDN